MSYRQSYVKSKALSYILAKWDHMTNSTVDDRERRHDLSCSLCKPNKGENAKRKPKHGKAKPKKKDKR